MPTYNWVCHVCKVPNRAGLESCAACGFPAVASGVEIDAAISGQKPEMPLGREKRERQLRARIAALPSWKKPVAYGLRGLQYVGWLIVGIGVFSLAADTMLVGFAFAVVAALLVTLLTWRDDPNSD